MVAWHTHCKSCCFTCLGRAAWIQILFSTSASANHAAGLENTFAKLEPTCAPTRGTYSTIAVRTAGCEVPGPHRHGQGLRAGQCASRPGSPTTAVAKVALRRSRSGSRRPPRDASEYL
ncbi:hypothetical protein T492DRAFT_1004656 [Pavlovales sp. CCMP2436]|nr:hypothetical protein T492DRAFT_1004656 [Pavlovales sp. CCMP2436]